ncbi:MAG: hypothetical protein M3Q53_00695 [Actinomycetota bacterium]|nr:hypothetical protein [Actinomycetota bacterium]
MGAGEERRYLESPRFRRRLVRGGLLLAVVGAGALVSIFFWNTANPVETPLSNKPAQVYVPNLPVTFAPSERKQVIQIAARFVDTAVKRDHSERAFELVGPNLRNGTTRQHWLVGDIPVVPYPVDDARWKFDYSYANEIGLQVLVFPQAASELRPMIFNMSLKAVGSGESRHWLVDSWTPRGGGGGRSSSVKRNEGSPFDLGGSIVAPTERAGTSLSSGWLLFPIVLLIFGALLVPLTVVGLERTRSRRAQRAYEASRIRSS